MTDKGYHSGIISGIAEFNGEIIEKKRGKNLKTTIWQAVFQPPTVSSSASNCQLHDFRLSIARLPTVRTIVSGSQSPRCGPRVPSLRTDSPLMRDWESPDVGKPGTQTTLNHSTLQDTFKHIVEKQKSEWFELFKWRIISFLWAKKRF